ncbi:Trans-aconitate 2-methyltransferase [subsurface metagenome]
MKHDIQTTRPEKEASFYNTASSCPPYSPLYTAALYYLKHVPRGETIVDLGCGPGLMAKLLFDSGRHAYLGIDFSAVLLARARQIVRNANFILADLRSLSTHEIYKKYRVFVLLEVLEHLTDDHLLLASIPSGSQVIFSVPNFDSKAHVRHFFSPDTVITRYSKWLDFSVPIIFPISENNKIFLFNTIRRVLIPH